MANSERVEEEETKERLCSWLERTILRPVKALMEGTRQARRNRGSGEREACWQAFRPGANKEIFACQADAH